MAGERQTEAQKQAAEIVTWLREPPTYNGLRMAANAIEREFVGGARQPAHDRTGADVAAEIVALLRSYANVHMTKALADLIEHKYVQGGPTGRSRP